jgi:hypothetical protein
MPLGKWLIISMRLPMVGITSPLTIYRRYAVAAMKRNQTDFRERCMAMTRCRENPSMECSCISDCPMTDSYFLEQIEHFLKDFPLRLNEVRLLHRCDLALSLKGYEHLVRQYLFDNRMTFRRCNALKVTHNRWKQRVQANAAEIAAMMSFHSPILASQIGQIPQIIGYLGKSSEEAARRIHT